MRRREFEQEDPYGTRYLEMVWVIQAAISNLFRFANVSEQKIEKTR